MDCVVLPAVDVMGEISTEWQMLATRPENIIPAKVVLDENGPAAIGAFSRNLLHPAPRHFDHLLAESATPDSLSPLLNSLVADLGASGNHPLHMSIDASDTELVVWVKVAGFAVIRTTYIGVLTPPVALQKPLQTFPCLADCDSSEMRRSMAELHARIYRRNHTWNPPAPILTEMAEAIFIEGGDLLPEHMWFAVGPEGLPIGVSSLRKTPIPNELDFGWIGVLPEVHQDVHRALFAVAVNAVKDRHLNIEVDDNDETTLQCFRELPVAWTETVLRVERTSGIC